MGWERVKRGLFIPVGTEWPVLGRHEDGSLILRPGFIEAVAARSNIPAESLTEDMIAGLLVEWYAHRCHSGLPRDPVTDELMREVFREDGVPEDEIEPMMSAVLARKYAGSQTSVRRRLRPGMIF